MYFNETNGKHKKKDPVTSYGRMVTATYIVWSVSFWTSCIMHDTTAVKENSLLGGGKLECLVTCPLHQSYSLCPSEATHFEEICAAHYMICSLSEHIGFQKKNMCASRSPSNYAKLLQKHTPC